MTVPTFTINEQFICSKSGNENDCEDAISINDNVVAVIDGATSKSNRNWGGETSGQAAVRILKSAIGQISLDCSAIEAINLLTKSIYEVYHSYGVEQIVKKDPKQRITASIAIFNNKTQEVWLVGDSQALIGDHLFCESKLIDEMLATVRATVLEIELAEGAKLEELLKNDPGREFIFPLLQRQTSFQNNIAIGELWYPVLDGFSVPEKGIKVVSIPPKVDTVVLATDGYPILRNNLAESEAELKQLLLRDPLLFRGFKSTKALTPGNESFDDRAYISLKINHT